MPVTSVTNKTFDIGYKWGTFSLAGKTTIPFLIKQSNRARNWERAFSSRKEMLTSLLEQGFLPTTSYIDNLQEIVNSKVVTVSGLLIWQPNSAYCYSFVPSYNRTNVDLSSASFGALTASVLEQLQSRISGNGTNLVVSAMEAKKTVGMIGDAVQRLSRAYSHVRHGKFKAAATALGLKDVPARVGKLHTPDKNWLEYRYGWRLVVYDLASLMKTLYDVLRNRPPLLRVTAVARSGRKTRISLGREEIILPNGQRCGSYAVTRQVEYKDEVKGGYVYELESVAIANQQSFGIVNPFLWAWELIPYSFVLDWILNLGAVLEGISAFAGKRWRDGWICTAGQTSTEHFWTDPLKGADVWSFSGSNVTTFGPQLERRFARTRQGFTPASIRVSIDLGVPRVLDAISLVTVRRH